MPTGAQRVVLMRMREKSEVKKILVSKRDAALTLSLSIRTIDNLIARNELLVRRVGSRTLIVASSLEAFAQLDHESPSFPKNANATHAEVEVSV